MRCRVLHSPGLTLLSSGYGRIGVAKLGEPRQEEGAVEQGREKIEDFMRRYGFEGTRVLRVLAVAVAMLLVLRMLRVLAVPVLIGAILIVGGGSFSIRGCPTRCLDFPTAQWWRTVLPLSWPAGRSADSR